MFFNLKVTYCGLLIIFNDFNQTRVDLEREVFARKPAGIYHAQVSAEYLSL